METDIRTKLDNAVKWYRNLSYKEQDRLIEKYITYGDYYVSLAKEGHLTNGTILEMMEKEGVTI